MVEALNPSHGVAPWSNPGDPVVRLGPDGQAITNVVWGNWCQGPPSGTMSLSLRLVTGMVSVEPGPTSGDMPPCSGTDPSSLSTTAFYAP